MENIMNENRKLKKINSKLENQIEELNNLLQDKDRNIEKSNQQIQFLKNNK